MLEALMYSNPKTGTVIGWQVTPMDAKTFVVEVYQTGDAEADVTIADTVGVLELRIAFLEAQLERGWLPMG